MLPLLQPAHHPATRRPARPGPLSVERRVPELVPVGIAVGGLAHAVRVGLPLRGLESPVGDLGDEGVEVVDEDGVHGVAGMLGPLLDDQIPMFREFPHGLDVVGEERRWGAEQPFVPGQRRRVVLDRDSREQVDGHAAMLAEVRPQELEPEPLPQESRKAARWTCGDRPTRPLSWASVDRGCPLPTPGPRWFAAALACPGWRVRPVPR